MDLAGPVGFDLDLTLIDSRAAIMAAWSAVAADTGTRVDLAEVDRRMERYRLQGGVYGLLVAEVTRREVARIEFVFAAAGEVRRVSDVGAVVGEVRALLSSGNASPMAQG